MAGPNVNSRISDKVILANIIKKFCFAWYITDYDLVHKGLTPVFYKHLQKWQQHTSVF
jgi:hypothetical protein